MDLINGLLEFISALLVAWNVRRLWLDKQVRGISLITTAIFDLWGVWNLFYYPSLGQFWSLAGATCLFLANATWTVLAIYYGRGTDV